VCVSFLLPPPAVFSFVAPPISRRQPEGALACGGGGGRYEALENPLAGDMHVMGPKFVAFKGPLRPDHPAKEDGEVNLQAARHCFSV
jgi:hypothetical protein